MVHNMMVNFNRKLYSSSNLIKIVRISKRTYMKALQTNSYGSKDNLSVNTVVPLPTIKDPNDVLIKVKAASINPIDVRMLEGYGASTIDILRQIDRYQFKEDTFPLTLGRDFSGVVVDPGRAVKKFKKGDEVWGALGVQRQGSHSEYVSASACSISHKPKSLDHVQAASIPYVGLTTWMALCKFGGMNENNFRGLRVLLLGGSGGVGTFAIQLFRSWGAEVTTTCSGDAEKLLFDLGAHNVLDYKRDDFQDQLRQLAGFDFIFDTIGVRNNTQILSLLKPNSRSKLVTLVPPFLRNTDQYGFIGGFVKSALDATLDTLIGFREGNGSVRWAFFAPDGRALDKIAKMVDNKEIRPVVESTYALDDAIDAYERVAQGHLRGKTVLNIDGIKNI